MEELKQFRNVYPTTQLMLLSLTLGTILMLLHLLFPKNELIIIIGYFYVLIALFVNLFAAAILVIKLFFNSHEYQIYIIRILILFSNVPIAALYLFIILKTL